MKTIINNRRATYEYFVEEAYEVGISLSGCEIKSLRAGEASLDGSYAEIIGGEMFLKNLYIKEYAAGSYNNLNSRRDRKLLMHRRQIDKLLGKIREKGYTLIPLKLYFKDSLVKVEIGLCKGKHTYDKRASIKEKDKLRDAQREVKEF
jgi:SsrA-binding protein